MRTLFLLSLLALLPASGWSQTDEPCEGLTGYADSTVLSRCLQFDYVTEGLDEEGFPTTITYSREDGQLQVWVDDLLYYDRPVTALTLLESLRAYNFAIRQYLPEY